MVPWTSPHRQDVGAPVVRHAVIGSRGPVPPECRRWQRVPIRTTMRYPSGHVAMDRHPEPLLAAARELHGDLAALQAIQAILDAQQAVMVATKAASTAATSAGSS